MEVVSYHAYLGQTLEKSPPKRKGDKTKARLVIGAAQALDARGYHSLRVSDICDAADIRMPTFYIYFKDKRDITFEVLTNFSRFILDTIRGVQPPQDPLAAITEANRAYIGLVQQNAGLMRSLFQFSDEDDEFRRIHQAITHEWYMHVCRGMQRRLVKLNVSPEQLLLSIYIVGGMIDQLIRDLYLGNNPFLQDLMKEAAPDSGQLSDLVSRIWYGGLMGVAAEDASEVLRPAVQRLR